MHCQKLIQFPISHRRQGTTLVEVIVAGILLGTVMSIAVPSLGWVVRERRAADRRQQATLEVENLMEQITVLRWNEITQETGAQLKLTDQLKQQLPGATLKCTVGTIADTPEPKRIHIELAWENRAGQTEAPVQLTTWVYRTGRLP